MRSPPQRLTRARAKDPEPATSKQARIVTAAAKAKTSVSSTLTANTKSTAAKRKARSDDADEEERQASQVKRPRGRPPKKPVAEEEKDIAIAVAAPTTSKASEPVRGARAKPILRKAPAEAAKEASTAPKVGRGRPRKVQPKPEEGESQPEPVKKATRGRPPTVMKPTSSTATTVANKPPVKKMVKFREPDKENMEPVSVPREPVTTGMRGRPARRGGAAPARSTRPATKAAKPQAGDKKPLSPKKITQLLLLRDDSEDELALEKVSSKPLAKSPIKPPSKKSEAIPAEIENMDTTVAVNAVMFDLPEINSTILASPPRRPTSPPRDTLKSPAKRIAMPLPGSALKLSNDPVAQTPFKTSTLLQSAAKRPQSPIKPFIFSAQKEQPSDSTSKFSMLQSPAKRAMPGLKSRLDAQPELPTLDESPVRTPTRKTKSSKKLMMEEDVEEDDEWDDEDDTIEIPQFSMRQSPELPSDVDYALTEAEAEAEVEADAEAEVEVEEEVEAEAEAEEGNNDEEEPLQVTEIAGTLSADEEEDDVVEDSIIVATGEEQVDDEEAPAEDEEAPAEDDDAQSEDTMVLDDLDAEVEEPVESSPKAEPQTANHLYQLRQKDLDPCHDLSSASDSEDDTLPFERITATPSGSGERTPRTRASRGPLRQSRRSTLGFATLSDQLGSWSAASPVKSAHSSAEEAQPENAEVDGLEHEIESSNQDTPMKNVSFGSEMLLMQPEVAALPETENAVESVEGQNSSEEAMITDEDMALAQEANEMSLTDSKEDDDASNTRHSWDDSLSDASQEYGDENQVPVDGPAPSSEPQAAPPVTPVSRPVTRSFNTTTKVPLKPADNSTPSPLKKKSFSASRAAPKRPPQPRRGAPVLSYADKPRRRSLRNSNPISEEPEQSAEEPSTPPAKMDMWASIGTPGRTPRKDLNPSLLRGAIVFVDVHTSEGADASGIFVELLTQMGARCPQKWNWNPSNSGNSESTKVGITHVVFKDGSKRTLEKVREAKGVVQCVGVSWVLDCERDNKWLDESPYNIDTSSVPRGGARRRKSMEPKAISNMNGSAVDGSSKRRESAPASPKTPNRRQSSIWIHTPSDGDEEEKEEEDIEWSNLILTPVPKTPAPETIMNFAMETPSNLDDNEEEGDENDASFTREEMLTRTCPPKAQRYVELGGGILSETQDDHVLLRLMAARRKSLQFAPKVGSPLAKMWQ